MANLNVTIVVRTTGEKRSWVVANGKTDPTGAYYLRYCQGSTPKYTKAGDNFHEAEIAQLRLERKLKAQSQGFTVPEEVATPTFHSCSSILTAYLDYLRSTTKRNGRKYNERAILSRESNIQEFLKVTSRIYAEQTTRADLLRYKKFLNDQGRANDTVYNKLAVVVTWLRHNQVVEIKNLLKGDDWPIVRDTESHPFSPAEIEAMLKVAGEHSLLVRLARATGMRKGEIRHAERSDVDPKVPFIKVKDKPLYNWETKTLAGKRNIPLEEALWKELLACPEGLLFPNKHGHPDIRIDRRFEEVGKRAGVKPPSDDRACWCHRWRDTFATALVRSQTLGLLYIAKVLGHEDTSMLSIYTEKLQMDSDEAKAAAKFVSGYGGGKPEPIQPIHIVKRKSNAA